MNNLIDLQEVLRIINSGVTLLTPNRRLAATLQKHFAAFQAEKGISCWNTPAILSWNAWLKKLWNQILAATFEEFPLLLNAAQESQIWESLLLQSRHHDPLLQTAAAAELARSAFGLLKQWRVSLTHPLFQASSDYSTSKSWMQDFEARCAQSRWLDNATLPDWLAAHLDPVSLPKNIALIGFNELSPQQSALLNACKKAGTSIAMLDLCSTMANVFRIGLPSSEDECYTAARWAKSLHEQDPSLSIGIVIPALDKTRDRVSQIFSNVFGYPAYNISAGKCLADYPVIHAALEALSLYHGRVRLDTLSYLLATPFLGGAEKERIKRAKLDSQLRKANVMHLHLSADEHAEISQTCPKLADYFQKFFNICREIPSTQSCSQWAVTFNQLLTALGWPGERILNSEEYQVIEAWLDLLRDFKTMDQILPPSSLANALRTLRQMASKQLFQPKSPEARIQILGILEAAALPFDALWVTGMNDRTWPPKPRPNPFIPKTLQRELKMPHATAERELHYCQQITHLFKHSASSVYFSHAHKDDEMELSPSPLIREVSEIFLEQISLAPFTPVTHPLFASKQCEVIYDDQASPLAANEVEHGGVDVIKKQALCPFKAFSECRLAARELESPTPGLRPKDRGTLVHGILEKFWEQVIDQAALLRLNKVEINQIINNSIERTLANYTLPHSLTSQYMILERRRLHHLITEWIEVEKQRPPFSVLKSEKKSQIRLDQLILSVRIDRIDQLANGDRLIMDYKTGTNYKTSSWFSERPEEPQLPLYALSDPDAAGITFAQLAPGACEFKGISHDDIEVNGIKLISEWQEQLDSWKSILNRLGNDYFNGVARVDPKEGDQTCSQCALQSLCRINEEIELI